MALNSDTNVPKNVGAPVAVTPLYLAGLALVFLGERVLATTRVPRLIATGLGVLLLLGTTGWRLVAGFGAPGERGRIERLLGLTSAGGTLAIAVALGVDLASGPLGLDRLDPEKRATWDAVVLVSWASLLLISLLPHLFAYSALLPMRRAERPESRRVRDAALSGLTLALAACYLGMFVFVGSSWGVAADYAYFKTAQPSESTRRVAAALSQPVRVVALFPQVNEVKNEVERYLSALSRGNPKLKVEYHDRLLAPKIARELRVSQDGVVVFARGDVRQVLTIGTEMKNARAKLRTLDEDVQKNLMKMARKARVAYLTVGHGELNDTHDAAEERKGYSDRILRKLLQMQNYRISDLGLPEGLGRKVPDDASIVFILGPTEPYAPEELAALRAYVAGGGHLFVALDPEPVALRLASLDRGEPPGSDDAGVGGEPEPDAGSANIDQTVKTLQSGGPGPNLEALAGLFGLSIDPHLLANDRQYVQTNMNKSDRVQLVTNRFSSHASVSTLSRHDAWVVLFGAGSLDKLDPKDKGIDFTLRSEPGTYRDLNHNFEMDGSEKPGQFNFAAAVERPVKTDKPPRPPKDKSSKSQESGPDQMRAFVIADVGAFSDLVLLNAPSNRFLFADAVRWLGGEESFAGEVNNEQDRRIEHTKQSDVIWFYSTILGMPALVLALGLFVSRRSTKKGGRR